MKSLDLTKTFSLQEVIKILLNVGIDAECGTCAEIAFTGTSANTHTCKEKIILSNEEIGLMKWCVLTISKGFTAERSAQIEACKLYKKLKSTEDFNKQNPWRTDSIEHNLDPMNIACICYTNEKGQKLISCVWHEIGSGDTNWLEEVGSQKRIPYSSIIKWMEIDLEYV